MHAFEAVLLMLGMVLLSNVLNRFIPQIAIPLIQVVLGMMLSVFTTFDYFDLSSEFFMLLFLAPLLFNDGVNVDKKALWREKKAIFTLSIVLVFVTVGLLGEFIHWLIPAMPIAGSFALAAALAPTDAVAVSALAEKVKIPHKMMHTLEGESLINDASGLVSFQFAVAALLTGTFSIVQAGISFVLISLGGVLVGIILSSLTLQIIRWLRKLGIENTVSFILLEILLPFGIFLVAEALHVNGILAVVSAGLVYSFSYQKFNPEIAQLQVLSKNTWSVFTFSLNGLVFVILGMKLPNVINVVWQNNNINNGTLILFILSITGILLGIRFLCFWICKNFEKNGEVTFKSRFQQTALYTISGVRGTITLISALSLPLFLTGDTLFNERELLISIAGGVILTTLLLANFTMPLFAEKKVKTTKQLSSEQEISILRQVVTDLTKQMTPENQAAIQRVITMYRGRILHLNKDEQYHTKQEELKEKVLKWQFIDTLDQLRLRKIGIQVAFRHMRRLNKILYRLTRDESYRNNMFYGRLIRQKLRLKTFVPVSRDEKRQQRHCLFNSNANFVVKKLQELDQQEYSEEMISFYLTRYLKRSDVDDQSAHGNTDDWLAFAIQLEREAVQHAFELGEMNRNDVKLYRENLLAVESTLSFDEE